MAWRSAVASHGLVCGVPQGVVAVGFAGEGPIVYLELHIPTCWSTFVDLWQEEARDLRPRPIPEGAKWFEISNAGHCFLWIPSGLHDWRHLLLPGLLHDWISALRAIRISLPPQLHEQARPPADILVHQSIQILLPPLPLLAIRDASIRSSITTECTTILHFQVINYCFNLQSMRDINS